MDAKEYEAGRRLNVPDATIGNWMRAYKAGKLGEVGKGQRTLTETELELSRLRRELAQTKMECGILKKAAAYFAKGLYRVQLHTLVSGVC